jgi:RNA polymerase sigma-70 factor (ECF subfamily)
MGDARVDARALAQLYALHGPMVYRRALRILGNAEDAQEALQEVFIRVLKGADDFEQRSSTTTWLYRITTNFCLNTLRDRKRRDALLEEHGDDALDRPRTSVFDDVAMRALLSRADAQQAQAALYVIVDGMSHDEAAELLGVSRRTVGNLIERFQAWAHNELVEARGSVRAPSEDPTRSEPAGGSAAEPRVRKVEGR